MEIWDKAVRKPRPMFEGNDFIYQINEVERRPRPDN
jgi:hypothetical protein